jgi:exopolysaccharide biosynthesis polyprenyl glycosylphosphotransferase
MSGRLASSPLSAQVKIKHSIIAMNQLKSVEEGQNCVGSSMIIPTADERVFKRMLLLERRRSERTGIPFALALLDVEGIQPSLDRTKLEELATSVGTAMRETDLTGWYLQSSTIGIILTTLNGVDRLSLKSIVAERVDRVLSMQLTSSQKQQVRISVYIFPELMTDGDSVGPAPEFYADPEPAHLKSKLNAVLKRTIDIAGSLAVLILLSPLFLVIAIIVKLTSRGPVLFRQTRLGRLGKKFTFLKFRSMYVNNDPEIHKRYIQNLIDKKVSESEGTFKIKNDPRITAFGRFLRKSSLDEVPQFINVLKGEMSLVGPRPPIPYEFEKYSLWHRRRILEVKPGITGEWQVNGRSRTAFDEMVRMDLRYIQNQCIWLDLKILLKTPLAVLKANGAY